MDADKPYDISNHPRVRRVSFEDIATPLTKEEAASFGASLKTPTVSTKAQEPDTGEVDDTFPWSDRTWDVYASTLSQLESGGQYNIVGGFNDAYTGAYQLGAGAIQDASQRLGLDIQYDQAGRQMILDDPLLQDRLMKAYTETNHLTLMRISSKYRALPRGQKLAILAASHLTGAGGGRDLLNGQDSTDGWDTKASSYRDAVLSALKG